MGTLNRPAIVVLRRRYFASSHLVPGDVVLALYSLERRLGPRLARGIPSLGWFRRRTRDFLHKYPHLRIALAHAFNDLLAVVCFEEGEWGELERAFLFKLSSRRRPVMRDALYVRVAECYSHTGGEQLGRLLRSSARRYMRRHADPAMVSEFERLLAAGSGQASN